MDEAEFWGRLEFRLCREFNTLERCRRLGLWCDGIYPKASVLDAPRFEIHGCAWIGLGPRRQHRWTFCMTLIEPADEWDVITWASLLPPDDMTNWLRVNHAAEHLDINLANAVFVDPRV